LNSQLPIEELEEIEEICREVIEKFPQYVRLHRIGGAALGFLAAQVNKEAGSKLNAKAVASTLKRMMEENE